MSARAVVVALIVIALAVGLWAGFGRVASEPVMLAPAWQLTPADAYVASTLADPVASWSPDSRSLLFYTVSAKGYKSSILRWSVGEKRAERVVYGVTPNHVDNDTFLYLQLNPKSVRERSLVTGAEGEVVRNLREVDLWRETTGFGYNPANKSIELRISDFTQFYEPGCQAIDFMGKPAGNIPRTTGGGVLDRSFDPKSKRSAVIFGDLTQEKRELRIAAPGEEAKSKPLASGKLGAVAWCPDGQLVAFSDSNEVKLLDLSDSKIVTVARFDVQPKSGVGACVCRLVWSPNGSYLVALDVVPGEIESNAVLYVLDLSKVKR